MLLRRARSAVVVCFLTLVCIALAPVSNGFAQMSDGALVRKLTDLTARKGYKDTPMGQNACKYLALPDDDRRGCKASQHLYEDKDGYTHAINVLRNKTDMFIAKLNKQATDIYLVDKDGRLKRFAFRRGYGSQAAWSNKPIDDPDVIGGFNSELQYWRAKLPELQREPDRK